ncbi:MAG: hypothetical protein CMJ58_25000 [Planctomycetaceae bacterium]|nr:hypothetical protein [Planctomycetaceae bacterium]
MSFLQPWLLAALPLAALPVIIHLINQRRFQNIEWGAMRFLLEANRMSRGYARIRQWLILLFRVLAIAALVFAITRPLARGWLGRTGGGSAELTLILLDRSASMSSQGAAAESTKLATGVRQLAGTLETIGSNRWVLIDCVTLEPQALGSPRELLRSPHAGPSSASADVPALMQAAHDYIRDNRPGQTEVWICSDLQAHDWNAASGQWQTLRDAFGKFDQGVRFHLLAYPDATPGNAALRVTGVERVADEDAAALLVSLAIHREGDAGDATIPVRFEIDGARSETTVDFVGEEAELSNYRIALPAGREEGWGRVSIPADADPADNEFYFVFAEPPRRRTVVVADDSAAVNALRLAATISPDGSADDAATEVTREQLAAQPWEQIALVVWQTALPEGDERKLLTEFVDRGGSVLFLPPATPDATAFAGVRWQAWQTPAEPATIDSWRGDQDLLARAASGAALPVGELAIRRHCTIEGDATPLASLAGGAVLLARAPTDRGHVYFLGTSPARVDSSLAGNGIVLYAMVQRALAAGAEQLAAAQQLDARALGEEDQAAWERIAGAGDALSTEYPAQAGVYRADKQLLAVNRSAGEDRPAGLDNERLQGLFAGLDFDRVDDRAGNVASLTREISRVFLVGMVAALVLEAALSLPKIRSGVAAGEAPR